MQDKIKQLQEKQIEMLEGMNPAFREYYWLIKNSKKTEDEFVNEISHRLSLTLRTCQSELVEAVREEERERILNELKSKEISPGVMNGKSQFTASDVYESLKKIK